MQTKTLQKLWESVNDGTYAPPDSSDDVLDKLLEERWGKEADFLEWREQLKGKIAEIFDDTDRHANDLRVISVVRALKEEVLAELDRKEQTK